MLFYDFFEFLIDPNIKRLHYSGYELQIFIAAILLALIYTIHHNIGKYLEASDTVTIPHLGKNLFGSLIGWGVFSQHRVISNSIAIFLLIVLTSIFYPEKTGFLRKILLPLNLFLLTIGILFLLHNTDTNSLKQVLDNHTCLVYYTLAILCSLKKKYIGDKNGLCFHSTLVRIPNSLFTGFLAIQLSLLTAFIFTLLVDLISIYLVRQTN